MTQETKQISLTKKYN